MTPVRSIAAALALALGTIPAATVLLAPATSYAQQGDNKITTREVATALQAAQKAMGAKDWNTAVAEIKKAQSVEKKTPFEAYQADEFLGYVYIQQKKFGDAAQVFERSLRSGFLPAEQVNDRTKTVAQLYFQVKQYAKSEEWSKKWLQSSPNAEDMNVLLAQSEYLQGKYKEAAATMSGVVSRAERANRKPDENWLQIVMSSHFKLNDQAGIAESLKGMVRHYPKDEYWANLLDIYRRQAQGDSMLLGYYRLMNEVGVVKDPGDYVEMAQLSMDAGMPGEAEQIVNYANDKGLLKGRDANEQGRFDRLVSGVKKLAAEDRASLPQLAQEAEKASRGQVKVALGQAYLSYGRYDDAIKAMQEGIAKGGLLDADDTQISLGIAYLKKGDKEQARKAFQGVKADSRWASLAQLWELRT